MAFRRRRARARREPVYWSRACCVTADQIQGPTEDLEECDISNALCGCVLFDPIVTQFNSTDARCTLLKLKWPTSFDVVSSSGFASGTVWGVVLKTSIDPTALAAIPLGQLLDGSHDILDIRLWPVASTAVAATDNARRDVHDNRDFELNVKRRFDSLEERVVVLYGFISHFGQNPAMGQSLSFEFHTIISALWQRSLR